MRVFMLEHRDLGFLALMTGAETPEVALDLFARERGCQDKAALLRTLRVRDDEIVFDQKDFDDGRGRLLVLLGDGQ